MKNVIQAAVEIMRWGDTVRAAKALSNQRAQQNRLNRYASRLYRHLTPFISITAKLEELGYTKHDFPRYDPIWQKLVDQPRELTDRSASY